MNPRFDIDKISIKDYTFNLDEKSDSPPNRDTTTNATSEGMSNKPEDRTKMRNMGKFWKIFYKFGKSVNKFEKFVKDFGHYETLSRAH